MLYLINPSRAMMWTELPGSFLSTLVEHDVDLRRLEWQESDRRADDATVALALRYGAKSLDGLVIWGGYVAQQDHPRNIARTHQKAAESNAALAAANGALLEQLLPGWTKHNRQLLDQDDESAREAVVRAEADLAHLLSERDADQGLVVHWVELGGVIPAA